MGAGSTLANGLKSLGKGYLSLLKQQLTPPDGLLPPLLDPSSMYDDEKMAASAITTRADAKARIQGMVSTKIIIKGHVAEGHVLKAYDSLVEDVQSSISKFLASRTSSDARSYAINLKADKNRLEELKAIHETRLNAAVPGKEHDELKKTLDEERQAFIKLLASVQGELFSQITAATQQYYAQLHLLKLATDVDAISQALNKAQAGPGKEGSMENQSPLKASDLLNNLSSFQVAGFDIQCKRDPQSGKDTYTATSTSKSGLRPDSRREVVAHEFFGIAQAKGYTDITLRSDNEAFIKAACIEACIHQLAQANPETYGKLEANPIPTIKILKIEGGGYSASEQVVDPKKHMKEAETIAKKRLAKMEKAEKEVESAAEKHFGSAQEMGDAYKAKMKALHPEPEPSASILPGPSA